MKLNGISVQGIYVYNEGNTTYEVGDMILYNNSIYIYSKSDEVLSDGLTPDKYKDYTPYLADKLASLQDWQDFINGKGEDKYITIDTLVAILNSYMNDMRLDGIIQSSYDSPTGTTKDGWVLDEYKLGDEVGDNSVIDEIFRSNSNYAIYRVSRKLQGLWMVDYTEKLEEGNFTNEDRSSVLVKQYTYYSSDVEKEMGIETRIQEIIDHIDGTVYYRSAKYDTKAINEEGSLGNLYSISNWHSTRISKEYEYQIEEIINAYAAKIHQLTELEKNLANNFKFKSININSGQTKITLSTYSNDPDTVVIKNLDNIGPITIQLREKIDDSLRYFRSHEITIEYSDKSLGAKYFLSDNLYVEVGSNINGDLVIKTSSDNLTIQSMYYKEFYQL